MDGRIEEGFRRRLLAVVRASEAGAREGEVERLLGEARARAEREGIGSARALLAAYEAVRDAAWAEGDASRVEDPGPAPRFLCDPSLGGLARWLHAAGYEAFPAPAVPEHRLPEEALRRGLVLLTTDAEVLARRIVADGSLRVVWLPSPLSVQEKLGFVLRELRLPLRDPRCMVCGGALVPRAKDAVGPRIPPRTARWKDEYFVCAGCDRLFWQGTHWERIVPRLRAAVAS